MVETTDEGRGKKVDERRTIDEGRGTKDAKFYASIVLVSEANDRPSSIVKIV